MSISGQPEFATNRIDPADEVGPETVANAVKEMINYQLGELKNPPCVDISTAYFNPGGYNLVADELEQATAVRLLLGAEPQVDDSQRARLLAAGAIADGGGTGEALPRRRRRANQTGAEGSGATSGLGSIDAEPSVAGGVVQRVTEDDTTAALERHQQTIVTDRDLLGFTREADARARRMVAFLRDNPSMEVRRYERGFLHGKTFIVTNGQQPKALIAGSSNFTYAGLARNNELNVGLYNPSGMKQVLDWFNEQWDASVPFDLAAFYEQRWEPHSPWLVFLRMLWELYGADLDAEAGAKSHLNLTGFQRDGVWRAKRILERRGGVLIADEVGLGKTYVAGELLYDAAIIKRQKVLIVAPATLRDTTWRPFLAEKNLPADVVSFEELTAHVENAGRTGSRLQALDDYSLVIVDEAHGYRNAQAKRAEAMRTLLTSAHGIPKDLVLLTATPVNNSLEDLYNLLVYFTPSDAAFSDIGIPSLRRYFANAMATDPDDLTPEQLFDVLDEIAVRRTRRFVKNHYVGDTVTINGKTITIEFPTPRVRRVDYRLDELAPGLFDDLAIALGMDEDEDTNSDGTENGVITSRLGEVLSMARYVPSRFRLTGDTEAYETQNAGLLRAMLLKRFESSAYAFEKTVEKMIASHNYFLSALEAGKVLTGDALREWVATDSEDIEAFIDELDTDDLDHVADAVDYDIARLTEAVEADRDLLEQFRQTVSTIRADNDPKIAALLDELADIAADATAEGIGEQDTANKRKVLLFTYYADTATYVYEAVHRAIHGDATREPDPRLAAYRDRDVLLLGGDRNNKTEVIAGFAPMTAGTGDGDEDKFDLLISTDVLAEGVNLQQARHIINYDLPWNPMRLVQRHGRIDRIGSPHREVFMRCFFPDQNLDQILALEARLQAKIKQAAASIGVPRILPGIDGVDRSITQSRDQIEALRREEAGLFEEGGATASGEEFRRRLAQAIADAGRGALQLPWTAGTGFTRPGVEPSIVFCARIGDHPKPWFRRVVLNADLSVKHWEDEEGEQMPMLVEDTLACLDHADPGSQHTEAVLTEDMYQAAFDAWDAAKSDIYNKWTYQSDPMNLAPEVPKVMRDAAALVEAHGAGLGDTQDTLRKRLNAPYSNRVLRQVRHVLNDPASNEAEKVERLHALATELNLQAPAPVEPLPPINPGDINLICWAAVSPTQEASEVQTDHPRDDAATADSSVVSATSTSVLPQVSAPTTSAATGPGDGVADMLTGSSSDELF